MYRIVVIASFLLGAVICGCGVPPYSGDIVVTEKNKVGAIDKTIARIEIDGMMCEVGCASKIKKELLEQIGVSNAKIDFEKGRDSNYAVVEFDPSKENAQSLAGAISEIADGKLYGVKSVEITHFAPSAE